MPDFSLDTTVTIDITDVKKFVEEKLPGLLLENTTDFGVAGFCLQTIMNEINRIENLDDNAEPQYLVPESALKTMIQSDIEMDILEADGVDNWTWYMESEKQCLKDWYNTDNMEEAVNIALECYEQR